MMLGTLTTGGPSVAVHGWVAWAIIIGAVAAALVSVYEAWTKVIRPLLWGVETLAGIASEFRPNGGGSLHDRIVAILDKLEEVTTWQADHGRSDGEQFARIGDRLQEAESLLAGISGQAQRLGELETYIHDRVHKIVGSLETMRMAGELSPHLVARLAELVKQLEPLVPRDSTERTRSTDPVAG